MSKEDHKNFNLIFESLLLEGKAGNFTDLMLGMVLAEKPPTWLQVMHERLKHLIISSERFKEKKKAEYTAQAKAKQNSGGKVIGKLSKGIRFWGASGKGKGKGNKTEMTPQHAPKNKWTPGSTIGIHNEMFNLFDFNACIDFYVLFLFHFLQISWWQLVLLWGCR